MDNFTLWSRNESIRNLKCGGDDRMSASETPIRGYVFAIVAWLCIAGLITNDPWSTRDGVWLEHLTVAFACLVGVLSCAALSMSHPENHPFLAASRSPH